MSSLNECPCFACLKTTEITLRLVSILGQLRMKFLRSPQKFLSQLNISVNLKLVDMRLVEFLRPSQKFCPSYHFWYFQILTCMHKVFLYGIFESLSKILSQFPFLRKMKILWEYDRAVVAPTYLVEAGIRSNVVPLSGSKENKKL